MGTFLKITGGIAIALILVVAVIFIVGIGKPSTEKPTTVELDACDSPDAADLVKGAVANGESAKILNTELLDIGNEKELYFDKRNNVRYCEADADLNSSDGTTKISYKLYMGPSGSSEIVEVQQGGDAFDTKDMVAAASAAQQPSVPATQSARSVVGASGAANQPPQSTPDSPDQQSACVDVPVNKGMKYLDALTRLRGANFQPVATPATDGSYCSRTENTEDCKAHPEIEDCSADGYCKMNFMNSNGDKVVVTTFGDGPTDPTTTVETFTVICR